MITDEDCDVAFVLDGQDDNRAATVSQYRMRCEQKLLVDVEELFANLTVYNPGLIQVLELKEAWEELKKRYAEIQSDSDEKG